MDSALLTRLGCAQPRATQFLEAHVGDGGEAVEAGLPRALLSAGGPGWVLGITVTAEQLCKEWGWEWGAVWGDCFFHKLGVLQIITQIPCVLSTVCFS